MILRKCTQLKATSYLEMMKLEMLAVHIMEQLFTPGFEVEWIPLCEKMSWDRVNYRKNSRTSRPNYTANSKKVALENTKSKFQNTKYEIKILCDRLQM